MDYIELYLKIYNKEAKEYINWLKKELKKYAKLNRNFYNARDEIRKIYNKKYRDRKIQNGKLDQIEDLFFKRTEKFQPLHQMDVIPQFMIPEFNKVKLKDYSFEDFINEFAKQNAIRQVHASLSSFNYNFNNSFTSKSIDNCEFLINPYDNLNAIKNNPKPENKNNYKIKAKFEKVFKNEEVYNHFTFHYVNDELTSFKDFKNLFLNGFDIDNSKIYFLCSTKLASLLLENLRRELFNPKPTQKDFVANSSFYSEQGNPITSWNLSKSKSRASVEDIKRVEKTITYLKTKSI